MSDSTGGGWVRQPMGRRPPADKAITGSAASVKARDASQARMALLPCIHETRHIPQHQPVGASGQSRATRTTRCRRPDRHKEPGTEHGAGVPWASDVGHARPRQGGSPTTGSRRDADGLARAALAGPARHWFTRHWFKGPVMRSGTCALHVGRLARSTWSRLRADGLVRSRGKVIRVQWHWESRRVRPGSQGLPRQGTV